MSKVPSAKEYTDNNPETLDDLAMGRSYYQRRMMVEFAKLCVEAALKKAAKKAYVEYVDLTSGEIFDYTDVITDDDVGADVNKDSILNAFPLDNIKIE